MEHIPEHVARYCLEVVKATVSDDARLYPPGHEGDMWVVSLEGYGDWTYDFPNGDLPRSVFAEPVTSWCLGLYPKEN